VNVFIVSNGNKVVYEDYFHTEKPTDEPIAKLNFLNSLVIITLKFMLKIPADIIQFVCSSVLSWSI